MPNHVTNHLSIQCPTAAKESEVLEFIKDGNRAISFQKIIPMPQRLNIESYIKQTYGIEWSSPSYNSISQRIRRRNKKDYGAESWYEWCREYWGTKWDAYDIRKEEDSIIFSTAWSTPEKVIIRLSSIFPDVEFTVEYADEDTGYNCGMYKVKDGKVIDRWLPEAGSDEAVEFACRLWDIDIEEYRKEMAEYE